MIQINGLTKTIGSATILSNVSLSMPEGSIIGLQGVNGSGKTMLIRSIAGLIKPTSGTITIDGETLWKDIPFPRSVGALIENPSFLPSYTGFENLKMLASFKDLIGENEIEEVIASVGLNPKDKRKYRKYSLGMKQRLGIAAAIMEKPDIVLLDEPTNALDESGVEILRHLILEQKARGATVVLASHDRLFLTSVADVIHHLENGKLTSTSSRQKGEPRHAKTSDSHA